MIVVKVMMWPGGDESKEKEFGRAYVVNNAVETNASGGTLGEYVISLHGGAYGMKNYYPRGNPYRQGKVQHFDRVSLGVWDLMYQALKVLVGYRTEGRSRVKLSAQPHPDDELL